MCITKETTLKGIRVSDIQINNCVNQDRHRTIHDLCAEVGIGYGSCQRILTEQLNMHRIAAKFVPRVLTQDQKDSRVAICQELKETVINDPTLLLNVITGDESIVYAYDPETKLQSSQWKSPGSPRPKKARMQKSKLKTMLICFFDQEGIVHQEFVPTGMTVNADFYCDVLRRVHENVRRKRPQKWQNQNLILHESVCGASAGLSAEPSFPSSANISIRSLKRKLFLMYCKRN